MTIIQPKTYVTITPQKIFPKFEEEMKAEQLRGASMLSEKSAMINDEFGVAFWDETIPRLLTQQSLIIWC